MTSLNHNRVLGILFIMVLAGGLGFLAVRPTQASKPAVQAEVVPTGPQQKLIKGLLAEKRAYDAQKDGEVAGAVKQLMSSLTDPDTGELGLNLVKWSPTTDNADGVKFVRQSSLAAPSQEQPK